MSVLLSGSPLQLHAVLEPKPKSVVDARIFGVPTGAAAVSPSPMAMASVACVCGAGAGASVSARRGGLVGGSREGGLHHCR